MRPVVNELRLEYQDRVNFVILDWTIRADRDFAKTLELTYHPNYASIKPNSDEVVGALFLEPRRGQLRTMIEELLADHGGEG